MWFTIAPGQARDTGVLKIVLTPNASSLDALKQSDVLGYENGVAHIHEYLREERIATRGEESSRQDLLNINWDALTKFITVYGHDAPPPQ
jgi:hypothetical protein